MALNLYNPLTQKFENVDSGQIAQEALLLNILIELRVHSLWFAQDHKGRSHDEINNLRIDVANDPESLFNTNLTSPQSQKISQT